MSEVVMLGPLDIHQYLLAHDVHHEIVRLPRPASSAENLPEVLDLPPRRCVATQAFYAAAPSGGLLVLLLVRADEFRASLALAPAVAELLRDRLGPDAVLAPAGADLVSRRTDYLAGHLTPLLLPPDVVVVATQAIADLATSIVYTATGDGGTALGIRAIDLLNLCRASLLPQVPGTAADSATNAASATVSANGAGAQIDLTPAHPAIDLDAHTARAVTAMGRPRPFRRAKSDADESREPLPAGETHPDDEGGHGERRDAGHAYRPRRASALRRPPMMQLAIQAPSVAPHAALEQAPPPMPAPGPIKAPIATAS